MNRKILKENAKTSFKRKYGESIVVALIMTLFSGGGSYSSFTSDTGTTDGGYSTDSIESILSGIPEDFLYSFLTVFISVSAVLSVAGIFLAPIFIVGGNRYFLKLRKGVNTGISEVIGNFKDGNYWNIVKIFFLRNIKVFFWTLLFIIPGIIKGYEYYLVDHILAVRPDLDSKSAFNMSKRLMDGHKWDAVILDLSFLGWQLLSACFTCGILSIAYVNPYMFATFNEFYAYVRAEGIRNGIITPMDLPDYESPVQDGFNTNNGMGWQQQGFQNQPPYQNQYNQQNPYQQPFTPQQPIQTPFWQQSNKPIGNVDNMPNEAPTDETTATEVPFTPINNSDDTE